MLIEDKINALSNISPGSGWAPSSLDFAGTVRAYGVPPCPKCGNWTFYCEMSIRTRHNQDKTCSSDELTLNFPSGCRYWNASPRNEGGGWSILSQYPVTLELSWDCRKWLSSFNWANLATACSAYKSQTHISNPAIKHHTSGSVFTMANIDVYSRMNVYRTEMRTAFCQSRKDLQ